MYTIEAEVEVGYPLNRLKPPVIFYYRQYQSATFGVVLYVACFGVSFCTVSPSVRLDHIQFC